MTKGCNNGDCGAKGGSELRIDTMNVRSLAGKMTQVLHLAQSLKLDTLCEQETRFNANNLLSAQNAAAKSGWTWLAGPCATDAQGGPTAGVAALCNWPVDVRVLPNNCRNTLVDGSASAVFAAFAFGESMFTRFNITEACKLAHVLFETMSILGEDAVFIGDWNNSPEEEPLLLETACCIWAMMLKALPVFWLPQGTMVGILNTHCILSMFMTWLHLLSRLPTLNPLFE